MSSRKKRNIRYHLQEHGAFEIDNYDLAKPFAGFFPGIAGLFGVPMWVFYVNRGQGIVSFGTRDKNHAILEYYPANRAWQHASRFGFRTFLKIHEGRSMQVYEPFQNDARSLAFDIERKMIIAAHNLEIFELNRTLGLEIGVDYFTLVNEPAACLLRRLTVKNTGTQSKTLEIADGLPQIVPYGVSNKFLKKLTRTIEAWMQVIFVTAHKAPYYKLVVDPTDRPQVIYVQGGNFYYAFLEQDARRTPSRFIVDPEELFGSLSDCQYPVKFFDKNFKFPGVQACGNKIPAAFACNTVSLRARSACSLVSLVGYAGDEAHLRELLGKARQSDYIGRKEDEYKSIIEQLQNRIFTAAADPVYNQYCAQTYLDNILRGGVPFTLCRGQKRPLVFHVYSRKHGDLERDYNNFLTEPTYYSQGNGNYRDINQNRRSDVWFNPLVKETNLRTFFNLIQLDGFNPLVVGVTRFALAAGGETGAVRELLKNKEDYERVAGFIKNPFAPGELFMFLERHKIALNSGREEFLEAVLNGCERRDSAEHGDGFWTDHWTYNIDALEAYASVYPEEPAGLLLKDKSFVYFDNFVKVKPREEKYVLYAGRARQYHAVTLEEIEENSALSEKIKSEDWAVRTAGGKGKVYYTTLLGKIVCLIVNKITSLDPFGCGIEMEANKPGWYDALNGLPALFGSSTCETMELKRLLRLLRDLLAGAAAGEENFLELPAELAGFLRGTDALAAASLADESRERDFLFWEKAGLLREAYRRKIQRGLDGAEERISLGELESMLGRMEEKLSRALRKAKDKATGLFHTYFINEVTEYEIITDETGAPKKSSDGLTCIRPLKFKQIPLPLFLEGQVHGLRLAAGPAEARGIYERTRRSVLYDRGLKMFKVNASLKDFSEEIGRARVFTPGWLENESVWLHMEYKFILELLRNGLREEFFAEFRNVLVPFQKPQRYGRSTLENSSFIVSSAYAEKAMRGRGFVARLSGSTSELITMWLWMNIGKEPFRVGSDGALRLVFEPCLASWMFLKRGREFDYYNFDGQKTLLKLPKHSYAFNLFGRILVVYHNPGMRNTYGRQKAVPRRITLKMADGREIGFSGNTLEEPYARAVRRTDVRRIDIVLG